MDGEWYALYSANYTATRVMKLNETGIEDWCGEDASPGGFCPVEYYIPRYHKYRAVDNFEYIVTDSNEFTTLEEFESDNEHVIEYGNLKFGFLCGCVWGDDSSWKIRYIDLSEVPNKKLIITDKLVIFLYHLNSH
jgi:hypothetical protein